MAKSPPDLPRDYPDHAVRDALTHPHNLRDLMRQGCILCRDPAAGRIASTAQIAEAPFDLAVTANLSGRYGFRPHARSRIRSPEYPFRQARV